jgi:hypothetical protein
MKETKWNFPEVLSQFEIEGNIDSIEPYGSGHIHDTYVVRNKEHGYPDYLLQRINHHVFKNISKLMDNITLVTNHLREKLTKLSGAQPDKEVLTLIPTHQKQSYYADEQGNYWRVYLLLKDTRSYDVVQTPQQAYEGGKAFGKFLALLTDLEASLLHESIPDFHNVENRLRLFREAVKKDPAGRVKEVAAEIKFTEKRAEQMCSIRRLGQAGKLPLRITHNDTKFNNVLLDRNDQAQCVIDLDTVMPGYVAYDFGDAIRTTIVKTAEDEKDLRKIDIDLELFQGFTKGFLKEMGAFLTEEEIQTLSLGVTLLPYIMGIRFLTDYIEGDTYYKTHFPAHNLQRTRAQFRLVEILEKKHELLQALILEIAGTFNQKAANK